LHLQKSSEEKIRLQLLMWFDQAQIGLDHSAYQYIANMGPEHHRATGYYLLMNGSESHGQR